MFSGTWFVILTLCGSIACVSWMFISNLGRRRAHPPLPPGPSGLPVVGSLPFLDPELHCYFSELAKTYGPLFTLRLGTKIGIVATSPSAAKEILKDHDVTFANHDVPAAGREATYGGFDVLWMPYGPEWRMLRKVCVREMLGSATLDALYSLRKHEIRQTMQYLKERSGSAVNVGDEMFLTAMNVLTSMLWGSTVEGEERAKLGADFRAVVAEITDLLGAPNVSDFFPALARFDLQGIVKKMKVCAKKLDDIFEGVIDKRRRMANVEDSCTKDVLQVLLDIQSKDSRSDSKTPFTMVHLKALLMDIVVAGTDTTSNTVEFAMAEIVNKPQVMRRAQQEIDNIVGSRDDASLEESHIIQLPYLHAIVKETLRLHPAVPLLVPHCPSESCIVGGHTIPKGSRVFINAWAIHRDPSLWEDPLEFKPERFLDGRHDFSGNDFAYLPFGSGRRICVGIGMAERMMMFSLASMLHYFDWKLPEGVECVVYLMNRSPTKSVWGMTPQEAWSGRRPGISHLRVFGSIAHVHVPDERRTKLDDKSQSFIFIGYEAKSKGYKLYNPDKKKLVISRDVLFDEEGEWDFNSCKNDYNLYEIEEAGTSPSGHTVSSSQEPATPAPSPIASSSEATSPSSGSSNEGMQ